MKGLHDIMNTTRKGNDKLRLDMGEHLGRGPSTEELEAVDYTPLAGDDWDVSTPAEQGLEPMLVAEMYYNVSELESIYSVLVIKNGNLIAERYFNEGSVEQLSARHSATKSFTSALVSFALE